MQRNAIVLFGLVCWQVAAGQCQTQKLTISDSPYDKLGSTIATSDDMLILGAPYGASAVFVYKKDRDGFWTISQSLSPFEPTGLFGRSIAFDGNWLIVGSPYANYGVVNLAGAAHVFHYDGQQWVQAAILRPPNPVPGQQFGWSVAIRGNLALIGISNSRVCSDLSVCDAVYVFRFNGITWTREQTIVDPELLYPFSFGNEVAVSDDDLLVKSSSKVWSYRWNGTSWVPTQSITVPQENPDLYGGFGSQIKVCGNSALITQVAYGVSTRVFLFTDDGSAWTQTDELDFGIAPLNLGVALSLDCQSAIIATSPAEEGGESSALVRRYRNEHGKLVFLQELSAGNANAGFGIATGMPADDIAVGSYGSAIVFSADHPSLCEPNAACEMLELPASTAEGSQLGTAVAIDGKFLVVAGATGAVSMYERFGTSWVYQRTFFQDESFGSSLALENGTLIVGAPKFGCDAGYICGAAFVYQLKSDGEPTVTRLAAIGLKAGDSLGMDCAIAGNVALVGAPGVDCDAGEDCGSAYVYRRNGSEWVEEEELVPLGRLPGQRFGSSVAIQGNIALLGNIQESVSVFMRRGSQWQEVSQLKPMANGEFTWFGKAVAVEEDSIVVTAPGQNCPDGESNCGAAYVFNQRGNDWKLSRRIQPSNLRAGDRFGMSLDIRDGIMVVGTPRVDLPTGIDAGVVYVFESDDEEWVFRRTFQAMDASEYDDFGATVATIDKQVLVGAPLDNLGTWRANSGSVHLFVVGPDCNGNGKADSCDIRDGVLEDDDADGVPDECEVVASLDMMPGKCPNRVKQRERGVIKAALAGREAFDVTHVDTKSLELRRKDGVGAAVQPGKPDMTPLGPPLVRGKAALTPTLSQREREARIRDVATFDAHGACKCGDDGRDGFDDLILKFDAKELAEAFELDSEMPGTSIEVEIVGAMDDGTIFRASDCITIGGQDSREGRQR